MNNKAFVAKLLTALLLLCTTEAGAEEREVGSIDFDKYKVRVESSWIISNEFITRLKLSPQDKMNKEGPSLVVFGEDGNTYDWAYILKKHMDWTEGQHEK